MSRWLDAASGGPEASARGLPADVPAPLDEVQWSYLQKRYELTVRERQVAEMVCQGLKNGNIAARLKIRPETVKTHVRNIYRKTGVKSKILLLLRFIEEARQMSDYP